MVILKIRNVSNFEILRKKSLLESILLVIFLCFTKETIVMLSFGQQKVAYLRKFHGFGVFGTNFTTYFRRGERKSDDRDHTRDIQGL